MRMMAKASQVMVAKLVSVFAGSVCGLNGYHLSTFRNGEPSTD